MHLSHAQYITMYRSAYITLIKQSPVLTNERSIVSLLFDIAKTNKRELHFANRTQTIIRTGERQLCLQCTQQWNKSASKQNLLKIDERSRISSRNATSQQTCPAANESLQADEAKAVNDVRWEDAVPYDQIPGPKPIPILGNVWRFLPLIGEYYGVQISNVHKMWQRQYGNIVRFTGLFGPDVLFLYSPEDFEIVLRNQSMYPIRDTLATFVYYRTNTRKDLFQDTAGLLTEQGEQWYKTRRILNQVLLQPRIAQRYLPGINEITEEFMDRVKILVGANPNSETPADFINEINKWALESICDIAMDTRLGCLSSNLTADSEPQKMIDQTLQIFELMYKLEVLPSPWRKISTPTWRKFVKTMDFTTSTCLKYINIAKERFESKSKDDSPSSGEASVLEKLLKIDEKLAFVMAIDMIIAGIDTTSKTAAAAMYFLAVNQDKQDKLHEELTRVIPDPKTPITHDILEKLEYLRAAIKESQRIAPIAIATQRNTTKDLVLSGYRIPKGTYIVMNNFYTCLNDKYYPEPEKFLPERWMRNSGTGSNKYPFTYLPFGHGARSCIGRRLAMGELEILLTKMFLNYKLEWNKKEMVFESKLLYGVDSPLQFTLRPIQ